MTAFGFCLAHGTDVEIDQDRRCIVDGRVTIPPSWGSASQQFIDGAWHPDKPRPEPSACGKPTRRATCLTCNKALTQRNAGGSPATYCSGLCKSRAQRARRAEREATG